METDTSMHGPASAADPSSRAAARIVERVFQDYRGGLRVRLWDGHTVCMGSHAPRFTLVFRDPGRFRELVLWRDPLRLAEAHFGGQVDIEGDLYEALGLNITLSRNQFEYARHKIAEEGLAGRVEVELRDYRDLVASARYDKIVSVGMFEHVGIKNLPLYFQTAQRLLKPGGLFLNHGITHDTEGWRKTVSTEFINRYVFPDGELDTVSNVQRVMEGAHFEILDVEALRPHYALTLRHWVQRLEARRAEALTHVSEATYRVWRLYMAACALEFEAGGIGVYQILAAKRGGGPTHVPLTRRDLYC